MPRRADNNNYLKWDIAYGENIDARAENILNGTVPLTVIQPNNQPEAGMSTEIVLDEDGGSAEVPNINFVRRYLGYVNPDDQLLYIRSQRYGEIVANTASHGNNDRGYIDQGTGILKSVYAVAFQDEISDNIPLSCSCESQYTNDNGNCKHMEAAQQFLEQYQFPDNFGDDDNDNFGGMNDDEYGGFNPNAVAEVQAVDPFTDGTIGGRLRQRRVAERQQQQPRRSTRRRTRTTRSGGRFDGDIYLGFQDRLYECVEAFPRLKL